MTRESATSPVSNRTHRLPPRGVNTTALASVSAAVSNIAVVTSGPYTVRVSVTLLPRSSRTSPSIRSESSTRASIGAAPTAPSLRLTRSTSASLPTRSLADLRCSPVVASSQTSVAHQSVASTGIYLTSVSQGAPSAKRSSTVLSLRSVKSLRERGTALDWSVHCPP